MKRALLRLLMLLSLPALAYAPLAAQQHVSDAPQVIEGPQSVGALPPPAREAPPMSNDTILRMHAAGLSDDLIVATIKNQPGQYQTGPDDLILLHQSGLSNEVLTAMSTSVRRPLRRTPLTAPAEPVATQISPVSDIGVYYKDARGAWVPMESEIVHIKSGGFIKSTLTHNIVKEDRNGVVSGTESKLLLPRPIEFLIYTPEGVEGSEYDLLRFRLNSHDREFRTLTGGVFHQTGGAQRDEQPFAPVKIAAHTYAFSVPRDTPGGEYGVLPPGTGNVTNGGKIYTFSISE